VAHIIAGKYEVLSQIGKGGMGVVYKVRHRTLETVLALNGETGSSIETCITLSAMGGLPTRESLSLHVEAALTRLRSASVKERRPDYQLRTCSPLW